jgi:hypothetical protein
MESSSIFDIISDPIGKILYVGFYIISMFLFIVMTLLFYHYWFIISIKYFKAAF